jgi:hypothetical protein
VGNDPRQCAGLSMAAIMCRQVQKVVKRLSRVLLLLLLGGAAGALALEDLLTVLVELELGDDDLGGGDGDGDRLAVRLLADNCRGG